MSRKRFNRTEATDQFCQALLSLKNIDECYAFLSDLLTMQETESLAQRLQVACLLYEGNTYETIRNAISVSSTTITRVNTELLYGSGGYQIVLERLKKVPADWTDL